MTLRTRGLRESVDAAKLRAEREDLLFKLSKSIDAEQFLAETLGAHNIRRNDQKNELVHSCVLPWGNHKNGDQNPSASLSVDKLKYNCWTCGGGDIFWVLASIRQETVNPEYTIADAIREITGQWEYRELTAEEFVGQLQALFQSEENVSFTLPTYSASVIRRWERPCEYLTSRGVSEETQHEMRTGVDDKHREIFEKGELKEWFVRPRLVIPLFFRGHLRGWQKRKLDSHPYGAKYRSSPGFPREHTLYGLDLVEMTEDVVVVESPASVLKMRSMGFRNVVATMGSEVTDSQLDLLARFDKVYSYMDSDQAGYLANKRVVEGLKKRTNVFVVPLGMEDTDPADYDREAIEAHFKWAEPAALWEISN